MAFIDVDFAGFVEYALIPTRRGWLLDCSGTFTSSCNYVTHSCFKKIV